MMQRRFNDDDGSVDNQPKVDGSQAHQVARHAEEVHKANRKEHRQRNHRRYHQSRPQISQKQNQDKNHDQCAFDQVSGHSADGPANQFGAVQKGMNVHAFGQGPPNLVDPGFHPSDNNIGILALQHQH